MRESSEELLRAAALRHFAESGFEGASLQQIADDVGMSKSSVLYHFASKEALFDAAMRPALAALRELVASIRDGIDANFVERFVNLLFDHRLAVYTLVNHGQGTARDLPLFVEANALVGEFATCVDPSEDQAAHLRFGFALAGAAFLVVSADRWKPKDEEPLDDAQFRKLLIGIVTELTGSTQAASTGTATSATAPVA